jgi:undecaprenyl phosphate-alpha-L-ara4N flippase subunit ArnE
LISIVADEFKQMMDAILKLLLFVAIMVGGQLLFKKAANASHVCDGLMCTLLSPWFVSAIFLYVLSTVLWVLILRNVPFSITYPFTALAFVIVPLVAHLI